MGNLRACAGRAGEAPRFEEEVGELMMEGINLLLHHHRDRGISCN